MRWHISDQATRGRYPCTALRIRSHVSDNIESGTSRDLHYEKKVTIVAPDPTTLRANPQHASIVKVQTRYDLTGERLLRVQLTEVPPIKAKYAS